MNRLAIPAILAATIMIVGIFALVPLEKASTVHPQIIAALQGANIVRVVFDIDNTNDDDGSITWSQIVTYHRDDGVGAYQIEKLFLCDFDNDEDSSQIRISYNIETAVVTGSTNPSFEATLESAGNGEVLTGFPPNYDGEDDCVDLLTTHLNFEGIGSETNQPVGRTHLGGDNLNDVSVLIDEFGCQDDTGTDTNGAVLVAYIRGLTSASQMDVDIVHEDDFNGC